MFATFTIGIKGVICSEGKCLVLKKEKPGLTYWDIPGGRMDGDESLEEALDRELREELPSIGRYAVTGLLDVYPLKNRLPDGNRLLFLIYKIQAEPFEPVLSAEHTAYRWVTKDELMGLAAETGIPVEPHFKAILKAFD